MKRLLILIIFFVLAVWAGIKIAEDPGYLLIAYKNSTIEMPLWLGILFAFLIFLIMYAVFRLFYHCRRVGSYFRFWTQKRRSQRAMKKTHQGFLEILSGNLKSGEKKLSRAADYSPLGIFNYINAAKAAFAQRAYDRSQAYLDKALEKEPHAVVAVGVAKATLELENQNFEGALEILQPLFLKEPHNPNVLELLKAIYKQQQDWGNLIELLPRLKKSPLETRESIEELEKQAFIGFLNTSLETDVTKAWNKIPKTFRQDPIFIHVYATRLIQQQDMVLAENIVRKYLKQYWDEALMELYGKILTERPADQLHFAQSFSKRYPENPVLLLCLGKLAVRSRLWGKAKYYLENCIKIAPSPEAYQLLGSVLEQMGDKETAFVMYRKGTVV